MLLNCGVGEDSLEFLAWTATRSDKSILKEINPEYSLKGLKLMDAEAPILRLPDAKSQFIGKDSNAGKD